ncbi:hypothetical protein [Symmachiella dynata]|tara:strand:- start:482 stop:631 length:150 start_codon:yes stop_codon:yes gene_type:complete
MKFSKSQAGHNGISFTNRRISADPAKLPESRDRPETKLAIGFEMLQSPT